MSSPIPVLDSISVTYSGRSEVGKSLSEALGKLFGVDVDIGDREADTGHDQTRRAGVGTGERKAATGPPTEDPGTEPARRRPRSRSCSLPPADSSTRRRRPSRCSTRRRTSRRSNRRTSYCARRRRWRPAARSHRRRRDGRRSAAGRPARRVAPGHPAARCQVTTTGVPTWAKSHRKAASRLAWRWQPPDSRVPSCASVWYTERSATFSGMAWKPMWPILVW